MAFSAHKNITNNSTVELFSANSSPGKISSLAVANTNDSHATFCDLFLNDGVDTFYILKNALIPKGTTLIVEKEAFNLSTNHGLYIKLVGDSSSTSSATVIIN